MHLSLRGWGKKSDDRRFLSSKHSEEVIRWESAQRSTGKETARSHVDVLDFAHTARRWRRENAWKWAVSCRERFLEADVFLRLVKKTNVGGKYRKKRELVQIVMRADTSREGKSILKDFVRHTDCLNVFLLTLPVRVDLRRIIFGKVSPIARSDDVFVLMNSPRWR